VVIAAALSPIRTSTAVTFAYCVVLGWWGWLSGPRLGRDWFGGAFDQPVGQADHRGCFCGDRLGEDMGAVQQQVDGVAYMLGDEVGVF
jgi:hypothetical protein